MRRREQLVSKTTWSPLEARDRAPIPEALGGGSNALRSRELSLQCAVAGSRCWGFLRTELPVKVRGDAIYPHRTGQCFLGQSIS